MFTYIWFCTNNNRILIIELTLFRSTCQHACKKRRKMFTLLITYLQNRWDGTNVNTNLKFHLHNWIFPPTFLKADFIGKSIKRHACIFDGAFCTLQNNFKLRYDTFHAITKLQFGEQNYCTMNLFFLIYCVLTVL